MVLDGRVDVLFQVETMDIAGGVIDAVNEKRCSGLIDNPIWSEQDESYRPDFYIGTQATHLRKL